MADAADSKTEDAKTAYHANPLETQQLRFLSIRCVRIPFSCVLLRVAVFSCFGERKGKVRGKSTLITARAESQGAAACATARASVA
jgi:hypothetical protein